MSELIYLDTHTIVWLHSGEIERLSSTAAESIEAGDCLISPIVLLELQYLKEIKRLKYTPERILSDLEKEISLQVCQSSFQQVIGLSLQEAWTRDPFDRIIVAQARLSNAHLITKDPVIAEHYNKAHW